MRGIYRERARNKSSAALSRIIERGRRPDRRRRALRRLTSMAATLNRDACRPALMSFSLSGILAGASQS